MSDNTSTTDNNELHSVIDNDSNDELNDHTDDSDSVIEDNSDDNSKKDNSKKDSSDDNCYDTEANIVDDGNYNRNKSYKVIVNIPDECKKYGITLITNVFTAQINLSLTMSPYLSKKYATYEIHHKKKTVIVTRNFKKNEQQACNYLMERCNLPFDKLIVCLQITHDIFDEYELPAKFYITIEKYINSIGSYKSIWNRLTSKYDYNLTLFKNRMLPYFHLECKDWVKANLEALKYDYPAEIYSNYTKGEINDEYSSELGMVAKNNNFMEWHVLPVKEYPSITRYENIISIIYKIGLFNQALTLILRLMLSPRDCHIVKSDVIWNILNKHLKNKDFNRLVRYCMYYAMYILRQEETIMFSQVNYNDRVLFKLEQANKLPTFDNVHIDCTPYIIQLTNDTPLSQSMLFYLRGKRCINDTQEFTRRFNIATGGAFIGVDFKSIGAAITGSILLPCVHKSPLENGFDDIYWTRQRNGIELQYPYMIDTLVSKEDEAFANYLEYYYPSYVSLNDKDFKQQVLCESLEKNVLSDSILTDIMYKENSLLADDLDINSRLDKISYENDDEIKDSEIKDSEIKDSEIKDSEIKDVKQDSNKLSDKYKWLFDNSRVNKNSICVVMQQSDTTLKTYKCKRHKCKRHTKPNTTTKQLTVSSTNTEPTTTDNTEQKQLKKSTDYNQLADIDISITTRDNEVFKNRVMELYAAICKNCNHRGAVHIKEVVTIASIKYKIYGPGIPRPIDVFRIPYEPVKMVKKFHIHAVKMYYDGEITMFRACIASLLSGVGESYKWFSCNKVPADVLLKYAQRGISIILNGKERDALSKYIAESDRWAPMLKEMCVAPSKIYSVVTEHHPFFRPGLYNCGIRLGLRSFERGINSVYANSLVIGDAKISFPYGEMLTHTLKKIVPPDHRIITDVMAYIDQGDDQDENNETYTENAEKNDQDNDNNAEDSNTNDQDNADNASDENDNAKDSNTNDQDNADNTSDENDDFDEKKNKPNTIIKPNDKSNKTTKSNNNQTKSWGELNSGLALKKIRDAEKKPQKKT